MNQALLKIIGNVQGVCYRSGARKQAQALGLSGYAKNLPDGNVEVLVQGEKEQIEKFIEWCKEGPSSAIVENIETNWQNKTQEIAGFRTC
jgi:acylphosphatase